MHHTSDAEGAGAPPPLSDSDEDLAEPPAVDNVLLMDYILRDDEEDFSRLVAQLDPLVDPVRFHDNPGPRTNLTSVLGRMRP